MNDNDVIAIIIAILRSGFVALSQPSIVIKQNYQPTQQGVPDEPALFLHKIMAPRYGFPGRHSTYNTANANFDTVESIWRMPTFQVSGLAQQDPNDIASLTASDIVEMAADILQTRATRQTLLDSEIGIFRIQQVRQLYFVNDKDRFEQEPSFDFTLSYRRTFNLTTPAVTATEVNISRV